MARPPITEQVQVNFRMPVDLRDRLKADAEANNRSMTAEIISILEIVHPAPRSRRDHPLYSELSDRQMALYNNMLDDFSKMALKYCKYM